MADGLWLGNRGYFAKDYMQAVDGAGGFFIVRGTNNMNPLIVKAIGPEGREVKRFRNRRLKEVKGRLSKYDCLDITVFFGTPEKGFECRLVVHPNPRADEAPRYLLTNLDPDEFSPEQVSDGYRLRWQIELLFKEWKSHANLHTFDTANPNIAEGLIWASLCAAAVKRYCAQVTRRITRVAMSTRIVAKCIRRVLCEILYTLMHEPLRLQSSVERAIEYLSRNALRAHPKRDRKTGRLKLWIEHVYVGA